MVISRLFHLVFVDLEVLREEASSRSCHPSVFVDLSDSEKCKNLPDHDSRPCSRSFRYKFRSLIPRILAAFRRWPLLASIANRM
jgi:hypothetical protein